MDQKPLVLKAKKSTWDATSTQGMETIPPFECGECGHVFRVRKYPDRRLSKLRCPRCQKYLGYVPTEEEALAAVRRATNKGVIHGREEGDG